MKKYEKTKVIVIVLVLISLLLFVQNITLSKKLQSIPQLKTDQKSVSKTFAGYSFSYPENRWSENEPEPYPGDVTVVDNTYLVHQQAQGFEISITTFRNPEVLSNDDYLRHVNKKQFGQPEYIEMGKNRIRAIRFSYTDKGKNLVKIVYVSNNSYYYEMNYSLDDVTEDHLTQVNQDINSIHSSFYFESSR